MHRLIPLLCAPFVLLASGCGGDKKPAASPSGVETTKSEGKESEAPGSTDAPPEKSEAAKKDACVGFDIANLEEVLGKVSCEEGNVNPTTMPAVDLKGKLAVTLSASPTKVAPGGKTDLLVTFANKTKEPLTLHFRLDPVPRFEVEVYDTKNKRADMPPGKPPPPPKGATPPPPSDPKAAKVTIAGNGSARARIPWEALKTKWAPEKVRGTPPERGYPRSPAGPLPKGKYVVKVITPLVGVAEQLSAPSVDVEIGG
jgi:hypothetical protein